MVINILIFAERVLADQRYLFPCVGTKIGDVLLNQSGLQIHVAGKIRKNLWQGKASLQIIVDDIALP